MTKLVQAFSTFLYLVFMMISQTLMMLMPLELLNTVSANYLRTHGELFKITKYLNYNCELDHIREMLLIKDWNINCTIITYI